MVVRGEGPFRKGSRSLHPSAPHPLTRGPRDEGNGSGETGICKKAARGKTLSPWNIS